MSIFSYKKFFGDFFFRKKCAGARAGAKAGVRVCALHTCVRCTLVCVVRVGADENLIQAGGTPVLALVQIKSIFLH